MVKNLLSLLAPGGVAAAFLVATAIPSLVSAVRAEENDARVEALLGRMTLAEKIGQLNLMPNEPGFRYDAVDHGLVGAVIGFTNAGEVSAVEAAGRRSRLGIPLLIGLDVIHGLRTMFPMPL